MQNLLKKITANKYLASYKKSIIIDFFLFIIVVGIYSIMHLYPFKTDSAEGIILDILFIFTILAGGNILIAYLFGKKKLSFLPLSLFVISVVTVAMVYFYKFENDWQLSNRLTFIEVVIGITSAIVVIWGGYLALKQINEAVRTNKIATQTNKLSAFSKMIDILQKEQGRESRKIVFGLFNEDMNYIKPCEEWTKSEIKAAHDTLADIDQIGLMVKYELLDYEFLEGWTYSIYKCLYILKEYKDKEEYRYSYNIAGIEKQQSNYFLGVNELLELRDKNIIYDYEKVQLTSHK